MLDGNYWPYIRWCYEGAYRNSLMYLDGEEERDEQLDGMVAREILDVCLCAAESQRLSLLCILYGGHGMSGFSTAQWEAEEAERTRERQLSMFREVD